MMITVQQLAQKILKEHKDLGAKDRYEIETTVREYISQHYLEAFSRVKARVGVGLPVDAKDERIEQDLAPYYSNFAPVAREIEQLLSGQATPVPYTAQPHQADPTQMSQAEYAKWRESHSPYKTSQGLIN